MRNATVKEILLNLGVDSLKEVCRFRGIRDVDSIKRRKKNFIEIVLSDASPWDEEQRKNLVRVYNEELEGNDKSITAHFFESEDLSQKGIEEIKSLMEDNLVVVQEDKLISPGFDNLRFNHEVITAIFKGNKENLVPVGDSILKETKFVQIPINILPSQGMFIMKGSSLAHIRTCRNFSQESLMLSKLRYSIPDGIKDGGVNPQIYNSRAKDFVSSLPIEVINGVFLKIGDQTTIKRIDYRGRGNILNEGEIKTKIRGGALIVGLKGYIRHNGPNGPLIEFLIHWGHLCTLRIRGPLSNAILEEILMKIYEAYRSNMLQ